MDDRRSMFIGIASIVGGIILLTLGHSIEKNIESFFQAVGIFFIAFGSLITSLVIAKNFFEGISSKK